MRCSKSLWPSCGTVSFWLKISPWPLHLGVVSLRFPKGPDHPPVNSGDKHHASHQTAQTGKIGGKIERRADFSELRGGYLPANTHLRQVRPHSRDLILTAGEKVSLPNLTPLGFSPSLASRHHYLLENEWDLLRLEIRLYRCRQCDCRE